jgi:predicted transcriptional regulator
MTVLERLVRKGRLKRRKTGRSFLYSPEASRDTVRRAAVRELVDGFFDGSEQDLVRFLAEGAPQAAAAASDGRAAAVESAAEEPIDTVLL